MNIARLIEQLMILTKYDLKFAVQLTKQILTVGFVTLRFYCNGKCQMKMVCLSDIAFQWYYIHALIFRGH